MCGDLVEMLAVARQRRRPDYWTDDARVVLPGQPVLSGKAAIREMVVGTMKIPGIRVTRAPENASTYSSRRARILGADST